jgi:hypothetical protein
MNKKVVSKLKTLSILIKVQFQRRKDTPKNGIGQ